MPCVCVCVFREDGMSSMKLYTNPTYFLELWLQEMDKQVQENMAEINKKRERRRVRFPALLLLLPLWAKILYFQGENTL